MNREDLSLASALAMNLIMNGIVNAGITIRRFKPVAVALWQCLI